MGQTPLEWYTEDGGSWDVAQRLQKCYAVKDAAGVLHVAQVELKNNGRTAKVPFSYVKEGQIYATQGFLVFEQADSDYVLSQVYLSQKKQHPPDKRFRDKGNTPGWPKRRTGSKRLRIR